jgi:predicted  nucleic acid-binding Zn-ribbon protein
MAEGQEVGYSDQAYVDPNIQVKDLEEKQRILKDRILLIGQNLIDLKEKTDEKMLNIKKDLEILKQKIERISSFMETISIEFSKFAKKDDLEILSKQIKLIK